MINKCILMVFINNLDNIGARYIKCSANKLEFCAPVSKDMDIYNIFGFCVDRVFCYRFTSNLNYYAIQ